MPKTRTPGITILADGRLFIDKRYLGVPIGLRIDLRVGAITQEQAEERLRAEMAQIEYEPIRDSRRRDRNVPRYCCRFNCSNGSIPAVGPNGYDGLKLKIALRD